MLDLFSIMLVIEDIVIFVVFVVNDILFDEDKEIIDMVIVVIELSID